MKRSADSRRTFRNALGYQRVTPFANFCKFISPLSCVLFRVLRRALESYIRLLLCHFFYFFFFPLFFLLSFFFFFLFFVLFSFFSRCILNVRISSKIAWSWELNTRIVRDGATCFFPPSVLNSRTHAHESSPLSSWLASETVTVSCRFAWVMRETTYIPVLIDRRRL